MPNLPFLSNQEIALVVPEGHWVRSGGCDQCSSGYIRGECCTKLAFPVNLGGARNPDVVHFWALHGAEVRWWGDLPLVIVPIRCSMRTDNGDCALYQSPERPNICNEGPLNPWAGKELNPACSYEFEWASNRKGAGNGI